MDGPEDPDAAWSRPVEAPPEPATALADATDPPVKAGLFTRIAAAVTNWWNDLEFLQMWHVVAVLALAATGAFGGLDAVESEPGTFTVGEPFDNGEFTITVHKATAVREITSGDSIVAKEQPGRLYVGIQADVTNNTDGPDVASDMVRIPSIPDAQTPGLETRHEPSVFRLDDSSMVVLLQPGITEKVAFVWSVPEASFQQDPQLTVELPYRIYSHGYVIYAGGWMDGDNSAKATLPVVIKP